MKSSEEWKRELELEAHPSGAGYFKPIYLSNETIKNEALPKRFSGDRSLCSCIYYLLERDQRSPLHKVKSDEQFSHIDGGAITIHVFNEEKKSYYQTSLGKDKGSKPYIVIPRDAWFCYKLNDNDNFALMTCTLSPAFDPADFKLASLEDIKNLENTFPEQKMFFNAK